MYNIEKEFNELLDEAGLVMVLFNMAQTIVQDREGKEAQALNLIVGSSFALLHAIDNYKEVKNGKSIEHGSGTSNSETGNGSSGSKSLLC